MNRYLVESERIVTVWYEVEAESEQEAYDKWSGYEGGGRTDVVELDEEIVMENFGYIKLDEEDI